jgi:hypothetical protein
LRKDKDKTLDPQEEAIVILELLAEKDFYVAIDDIYIYSPDGKVISRLILVIAFFSKE